MLSLLQHNKRRTNSIIVRNCLCNDLTDQKNVCVCTRDSRPRTLAHAHTHTQHTHTRALKCPKQFMNASRLIFSVLHHTYLFYDVLKLTSCLHPITYDATA